MAALKEREAQAQHLADRDALTGLYNRRKLTELLDSAIADAARRSQQVGLLFIDLGNCFKAINDEYGHAAGDKILTMVASRVSARVRAGDLVCRYGGDEFVVVLPYVPDPAAVAHVADTIRERVALPYRLRGHRAAFDRGNRRVGHYPRDGDGADELLHRADQAMYRLKTRAWPAPCSASDPPFRNRRCDGGATESILSRCARQAASPSTSAAAGR